MTKMTKGLSGRSSGNVSSTNVRSQDNDSDEEQGTGVVVQDASEEREGGKGSAIGADSILVKDETANKEDIAWNDLQVINLNAEQAAASGSNVREFLAAMEVAAKSSLATKTASEIGLDKLPGVFLVSIDRPTTQGQRGGKHKAKVTVITRPDDPAKSNNEVDPRSDVASLCTVNEAFTAISLDAPLQDGDVLWFAGSASAVGDLRKIPGLVSYESEEVEKINEKVHDRRLVEAVIARRGPLVGKTVKEIKFRTKFGAAVIAVHRDGNRVHEHPGKIKLQAGDVLLLEAGPTFIKKSVENNRSFALLAEVEDSAPPRMALLIPAIVLIVTMLAVYTAGIASLLICALIASMLMVCIGLLSEQEARDAVNWEIYIAIASAFGIGTALVNSGVAASIAGFLVDIGEGVGLGGKLEKPQNNKQCKVSAAECRRH